MINLREGIARIQHDNWVEWMEYFFTQCDVDKDGNVSIPLYLERQWKRQMRTLYKNLPELEKQPRRDQASKVIAVLKEWKLV